MITKKVILDVDPGIEDAVAMTLALFEPQWEVVAVTATGGNVLPDQATRNVQAIIEQLDPPRWPRLGVASLPDDGLPVHSTEINGADGLGNASFPVSELQHRHLSEKVLLDQIRAAKEDVTLVALGPLTNIDRALHAHPELAGLLGQMVIKGGAFAGPGDITAAAEFNIFCDPPAARRVFRTPTTKTLIPLDVTRQVLFTYDLLDQLPRETSRAGRFLRKVLPFLFRSHRQVLGVEGIYLHDAVARLLRSIRNCSKSK